MSGPRFTTSEAKRCYQELSEAARGHDSLAVFEAAGVLLAQAISSGSYDLQRAQDTVALMAAAMSADIASNWPTVIELRRSRHQ